MTDKRRGDLLLILPTDRVGGAERVMKTLLAEAAKDFDAAQVLILARGRTTGFWEDVAPNVSVTYLNASRELTGAYLAFRWLYKRRKHPFALSLTTHVHTNSLVSIAHRLGWLGGGHVFRESSNALRYAKHMRRLMSHFYYFTYLKGVPCICQTELMKSDLLEFSRFAKGWNLAVIPNPIDAERVNRLSLETFATPVPDGAPYIVGVGWLRPDKRFDLLIEAFAEFSRRRGGEWHLCIAGEGPMRGPLEELVRAESLDGCVHLTGNLANPYPLMRGAKMGVVSSRVEGFPNVLLEMMALSPCVVSTLCAGGVERLPGIETAPTDDLPALVAAMERAADNAGEASVNAMRGEVNARSPASFWGKIKALAGIVR
jgi:glycosyltransferase involved in cell wall biosynthesis